MWRHTLDLYTHRIFARPARTMPENYISRSYTTMAHDVRARRARRQLLRGLKSEHGQMRILTEYDLC